MATNVGVLFHLETAVRDVYGGPGQCFSIWTNTAHALGANWIGMVDHTRLKDGRYYESNFDEMAWHYFDNVGEAVAAISGMQAVVCDTAESLTARGLAYTPLPSYVHPTGDCVYVFGEESGPVPPIIAGAQYLTIQSEAMLHGVIAAAIVLHDRRVKSA